MTSDSTPSSVSTAPATPPPEINRNLQVRFKSEGDRLLLILPSETEGNDPLKSPPTTWSDICQQMRHRLNAGDRFWQPNTQVNLIASDRLLDVRQLQEISDALAESNLQLKCVYTSRRQTAVAAATAGYSVEQRSELAAFNQTAAPTVIPLADPLYLETTVRSGVEIRHQGNVVIVGDVNPGGTVIAEGDILIWGRLRGIAHAGAGGNPQRLIMALQMEPTQIRIADFVARAPENPPAQFHPEVAYVSPQGIRIAQAADFSKSQVVVKSS